MSRWNNIFPLTIRLVVFGAFSVQFWVAGLVKSYGVLFVEILEIFPTNSTAVASWIPAVLSALCKYIIECFFFSIFGTLNVEFVCFLFLIQRFGSCTVVQRIVSTFFLSLCSIYRWIILRLRSHAELFCHKRIPFAHYIWHFNWLAAAPFVWKHAMSFRQLNENLNSVSISGIGGGLSTTPGIIIVSMYFNKRRALANGICVSGTAAGSFIFPILIEYLIHKFGFHGTLLLLGAGMLHVCVSATLYRPYDENWTTESAKTNKCENSSNSTATNLTLLSACNSDAKRYIEQLFMEESKNRLNDLYNTNKLGKFSNSLDVHTSKRKDMFIKFINSFCTGALNDNSGNGNEGGDDEYADTMGETKFTKPISAIRPTRSSSILHSVEDLSTDSTCVYKSRSGYDSNRGSRRRIITQKFGNRLSNDEIPDKQTLNSLFDYNNASTIQTTNNRGLSKSMILPTPVSDWSEMDDDNELKQPKTICEKIQRYTFLIFIFLHNKIRRNRFHALLNSTL